MSTQDRKRGLGRGLSALMSDVSMETAPSTNGGGAQKLPIEQIFANPDQPRKSFVESDLNDLANSIREKGIIQPLIVREMSNNQFQIVAGERRWRAAQMANLHEVPVVVREFTDLEVIEIAIIENVQRSDLNPVEEALGYRQLMEKFGHTQEKMAEALGKSRSHIANVLRLLQLPHPIQDLLAEGKLSSGHARALITAENPEALAEEIVAKGLSVRAVEGIVKKQNAPSDQPASHKVKAPGTEKDADTKALESDLTAAVGLKVQLNHDAGKESGSVKISYTSLDQLDEICRILSGG
ncbi:MAG: ParB/RepB/Spo0J family partition protein [Paracoccaceae bacterium]